ncbi:head maturation protease, ClpP-related [Aquitalea sp. ASV11]|uniref:head maturation protease, ClpP-related n=1 Tax=Aquitalea sp. ASV11 TaxID=2795103 RepID=UPI0018EB8FD1|nr:head maturation protease, ClpP-related [Aquitalea sp. ASV11]
MKCHPTLWNMAAAASPPAADGSWYRLHNQAGQPLEITLYDGIGNWGIRASDFLQELKAADDGQRAIIVAINSLGGDVFDGIAIHNALRRLGNRVTVRIDSVAASIASVIAAGGARVVMPANAMLMLHNPWTVAGGEAEELRQVADMMDKSKASLIACYQAKAPTLDSATLSQMMDDTTWLSAQEALALGLVDEVREQVTLQASASLLAGLARLKNAPAHWLAALHTPPIDAPPVRQPDPPPAADPRVLARLAARLCAEAGLSASAVDHVLRHSALQDEAAIQGRVQQLLEIRDLCQLAKLPELQDSLMASGLDTQAVRSRLFDRLVQQAGQELDNVPPEPSATPQATGPSARNIYARRQQRPAGQTAER